MSVLEYTTIRRFAVVLQGYMCSLSTRPSGHSTGPYAPMGADGWVCSLLYAVYQMLSLFFPCTATVNGAAGHNRGEVAETPPLART